MDRKIDGLSNHTFRQKLRRIKKSEELVEQTRKVSQLLIKITNCYALNGWQKKSEVLPFKVLRAVYFQSSESERLSIHGASTGLFKFFLGDDSREKSNEEKSWFNIKWERKAEKKQWKRWAWVGFVFKSWPSAMKTWINCVYLKSIEQH